MDGRSSSSFPRADASIVCASAGARGGCTGEDVRGERSAEEGGGRTATERPNGRPLPLLACPPACPRKPRGDRPRRTARRGTAAAARVHRGKGATSDGRRHHCHRLRCCRRRCGRASAPPGPRAYPLSTAGRGGHRADDCSPAAGAPIPPLPLRRALTHRDRHSQLRRVGAGARPPGPTPSFFPPSLLPADCRWPRCAAADVAATGANADHATRCWSTGPPLAGGRRCRCRRCRGSHRCRSPTTPSRSRNRHGGGGRGRSGRRRRPWLPAHGAVHIPHEGRRLRGQRRS